MIRLGWKEAGGNVRIILFKDKKEPNLKNQFVRVYPEGTLILKIRAAMSILCKDVTFLGYSGIADEEFRNELCYMLFDGIGNVEIYEASAHAYPNIEPISPDLASFIEKGRKLLHRLLFGQDIQQHTAGTGVAHPQAVDKYSRSKEGMASSQNDDSRGTITNDSRKRPFQHHEPSSNKRMGFESRTAAGHRSPSISRARSLVVRVPMPMEVSPIDSAIRNRRLENTVMDISARGPPEMKDILLGVQGMNVHYFTLISSRIARQNWKNLPRERNDV
jgi:hypothetical protein